MKKLYHLGLPIAEPIDMGRLGNNSYVYLLLSWLDGEDAEAVLPKMSEEKQYLLGVSAGRYLRQMHTVTAPSDMPWAELYQQKVKRKIEGYRNCPVKLSNDATIIQFINEQLHYLKDRVQTFQHGDYHLGNLIVTPEQNLAIIDFNRSSYGDPWEEFDRFIFTWRVSVPFANGQIHGYFNNCVPEEFFHLLALYSATNILSSIPWALAIGEDELKTMLMNATQITDCFREFSTPIPKWYKEPMTLA